MKIKGISRILKNEKTKLSSLPKLKETRLGQVWFVFYQVLKLSWQVSPKLLVFDLLVNVAVGFLIYPALRLEKIFIDSLIEGVGADFWGPAGQFIILVLFLRFLVGIIRDILGRAGGYFRRMMSRIFSAYLTSLIAKKNAELDILTLDDPEFRDKFAKIQRESGRRAWGMMYPLSSTPMTLAGLISTLIIISSFHPAIGLVILLLSIPVFLVDAKYIKKEYQFEDEMNPLYRIWGWLEHYLLRPINILEIKLLGLADPFSKRITEIQNKIFSERIRIEKKKTISQVLASIPQNVFHFLVGIYLALFVFIGKLTVGSAEMILRAISSFRDNLSELVSNFLELYENYLYVSDLVWLLSLEPKIKTVARGKKVGKKLKRGIEFENIWFRYVDKGPWILKDVNLKIGPDQEIAMVGENGAGKSTIVKLICRFYDPQRGKILLNGVDLKKYSIESLLDNLSVLFQDFEIYPFSAKESIGYGDIKKANKTNLIKKAARKAGIDEYIRSLELGYETPLHPGFEKGTRPSVGQWQRIALARVFLRDAKITILDEPTSNVDPRAEEQIFQRIMKQSKDKILILISHRFHTVRQADQIYVIDKGRIAETGAHQELMKKKGMYAELFELQAKSYR